MALSKLRGSHFPAWFGAAEHRPGCQFVADLRPFCSLILTPFFGLETSQRTRFRLV
jgi:hypothetical protein